HARGWTRDGRLLVGHERGSPARAGMDPRARRSSPPTGGLPRTRGDGPNAERMCFSVLRAPPHARGWTMIELLFLWLLTGSPARAGMDPTTSRPFRASGTLP